MSLVKHNNGVNWYYRFTKQGKTYFGSTGTTNKAVAARIEEKKKREVIERVELGVADTVTVKQALDKYLDSKRTSREHGNIKSRVSKLLGSKLDIRTLKPITVFGFDGGKRFDQLTNADAQRLVLARRNEQAADGTILVELSALSQAIKLVQKLGYAVPKIDFASIKRDSKVKPHKGKLRFLTAKEEAALLEQLHPDTAIRGIGTAEVRNQRLDAHDLAILLFDVGGRYSELAKLEWNQVNLAKRTIRLYRSKVKNESTLLMTDRVHAVLTRRHAASEGRKFVFEAKDGTARKYSPAAFQSAFKRAGIEGATIHSLRHTFGTKLADAEVGAPDIQNLMGHADIKTTMIYVHASAKRASAKAVEVLNAINRGA